MQGIGLIKQKTQYFHLDQNNSLLEPDTEPSQVLHTFQGYFPVKAQKTPFIDNRLSVNNDEDESDCDTADKKAPLYKINTTGLSTIQTGQYNF